MAELKSLIVNGITRLNNTGYAKNLYADKFITNGGTAQQYVKGDGTLGNISDFSGSGHNHDARYVLKAGDTMTGTLIFSGVSSSNWTEGIRINDASNGWTTITMGGTATSGTGASIWSFHTNGGNFYLAKNGSSSFSNGLSHTSGQWLVKGTGSNYEVAKFTGPSTHAGISIFATSGYNPFIRLGNGSTYNSELGYSYGKGTMYLGAYNTDIGILNIHIANQRVGIGTYSPESKLDVDGIQQIYQRGLDNTAFKDLLLIKGQNSTELSGDNWNTSQPTFGIGFRRYWTSSGNPYGETTHAGIYSTISSNWRGGLVFRTKNNQTQGGTHDTTALRLAPSGAGFFYNQVTIGNTIGDNGSYDRLIIIPRKHTGGPWKITSYDDDSYAYLQLNYAGNLTFSVRHDGWSKTTRLWLTYTSNNSESYSWTNAALISPSIEVLNYTGTVDDRFPTLTLHHYGYGGPRLSSRRGIFYVYGGNTDAKTLGSKNDYFKEMRIYPNVDDGLFVNDVKVLLGYRRLNLNISSTDAGMIPPSILEFKNGYPLHTDPEFASGNNGISVYDNNGSGNVTITRQDDSTAGNSSGKVLKIHSDSGSSPAYGGWYFADGTVRGRIYTCIFRAKIPDGYTVEWTTNNTGTGSASGWLTNHVGTGKWEWYAYQVECGTASLSSTNFLYISTGPCDWYLSFANTYINTYANYDGLRTRYADSASNATTATGLSATIANDKLPTRLQEFITSALTAEANGFGRITSSSPFKFWHTSADDCMLITTAYSSSWAAQLATDYRTNYLAIRNKNNGTWNSWAYPIMWQPDGYITNCNSVDSTGVFEHSSWSNRPSGTVNGYGTLFNLRLYKGDNNYHRQLFFDCYGTDRIWTRSDNGGTWTGWSELVTTKSYTATAVTGLDGTYFLIHCTVSASATLGFSTAPCATEGRECHLIIYNSGSSNITITIPTTINSVTCRRTSGTLVIAPSSFGDISIVYANSLYYIRCI